MSIIMFGIDHTKANIDERSIFSFPAKSMSQAYSRFLNEDGVSGCVIISTCNRMELWLSTEEDSGVDAPALVCDYLGLDQEDYEYLFIERKRRDAVDHLFRLAAGLESKIVGEDQIITQVGDALSVARSFFATDKPLEVLFRTAVTAGKKVKTNTDLSFADHSVIHAAISYLAERNISVAGKKCLVIGNGMMGKLSAKTLLENNADVTVTVRKYHHNVVEVPDGCRVIDYSDRYEYLPECDLIVSATSSQNYTISKEELPAVDHEIHMIDLAIPRDIDRAVGEISGINLYDIDSFNVDIMSDKLKLNLKKAEYILEEEKKEFYDWWEGRDYMPLIQRLKKDTGADVDVRLTPVYKKLPLDDEDKDMLRSEIRKSSERMMNHLIFELKGIMDDDSFKEMLDAMNQVMSDKGGRDGA